ncbi:hypothetical protein OH77DRAFT_488153 [Trametes cingulata]|nr:hypothetical protein OH77DRAFT_488153 [Trametes cingulata]
MDLPRPSPEANEEPLPVGTAASSGLAVESYCRKEQRVSYIGDASVMYPSCKDVACPPHALDNPRVGIISLSSNPRPLRRTRHLDQECWSTSQERCVACAPRVRRHDSFYRNDHEVEGFFERARTDVGFQPQCVGRHSSSLGPCQIAQLRNPCPCGSLLVPRHRRHPSAANRRPMA